MDTSDSLSLAGKIAIITGSAKSNGIGAGIALTLARAGARVVINYVSESSAQAAINTAASIETTAGKGCAIVVQADLGSPDGAKALVDGALRGFGVDQIDIIVNNAVWSKPGPALHFQPQDLHRSFAVTVFGPLYLLQCAMPHMSRGGRVINIGSVASKLGFPGTGMYGASKSAMDALTFTLAQEVGRDGKGITINTIMPGPVPTSGVPANAQIEAAHNRLVSMTRAENRLGAVEDISDVVLLLSNERSRWITGQIISVSGGITGGP